ncbi:MAG: hypothetical protein EZS28_038655 [Streblomastix strix]|uniref:Uncharacterized protein n=1 Tax=Streblomastix strix TaxID=222440 RepID=A0A5J4U627_9EUKA|nr:MAG: hypothetical protein EZS28_038655 [Streblomastix strix]
MAKITAKQLLGRTASKMLAVRISGEEFMIYAMFLNQLVSVATKNDPEIELRFILRQYNKRLKMDQLKEIIEIAQENSQSAVMKLIQYLNERC